MVAGDRLAQMAARLDGTNIAGQALQVVGRCVDEIPDAYEAFDGGRGPRGVPSAASFPTGPVDEPLAQQVPEVFGQGADELDDVAHGDSVRLERDRTLLARRGGQRF